VLGLNLQVNAFGQHRLEATAPWGLIGERQTEERVTPSDKKISSTDLAHFVMLARGNCWLSVDRIPEPIPLTGGDGILLARDTSIVMRDSPRTRLNAQSWARYQQRFPAMVSSKIFLSLDEYAYFGGTFNRAPDLKLALAYAMIFNEMLRHTDFLRMSAHTMGVSTIDYTPVAATLNPTGLLFKLYGDAFVPGSIPVALSANSPQPAPHYPIGGDQPETNFGSPTYPLDMFAALTPDRKYLNLAVVNATGAEQKFNLGVTGLHLSKACTVRQLTGKDLDAANRLGQPPRVEIEETTLGDTPTSATVAPNSVSIFRFTVTR
jgi:alpha-N-arabinofuranosidase